MNDNNFSQEQKKLIIQHLLITKNSNNSTKNYSHVPCKFFKQGNCQAGTSCPFSHSLNPNQASVTPCKYYKLGNCKFGSKCANAHIADEYTTTPPLSHRRHSSIDSDLSFENNTLYSSLNSLAPNKYTAWSNDHYIPRDTNHETNNTVTAINTFNFDDMYPLKD